MKVTVCELRDDPADLEQDWQALVEHGHQKGSELILLPEMPFSPWLAWTDQADPAQWRQCVQRHDQWMARLEDLFPATVVGTRAIIDKGAHFNEGFVVEPDSGYKPVHRKYYLPDEDGFWEATWYQRGEKDFTVAQTAKGAAGFLICTEMWFTEHARSYARKGIHFLLSPRATPSSTAQKWIAGGRAAAVVSGAYSLSSNRSGTSQGVEWGSNGWVIDPEGEVLGLTSPEQPFLTVEVDSSAAEQAKQTYPRYVLE
jgi:N-carbamoylputrescine amidase